MRGVVSLGGSSGIPSCSAPLFAPLRDSPRSPGGRKASPVSPPPGTAGPHRSSGDRALPSLTSASPRREFRGSGLPHRGTTGRDRSTGASHLRPSGGGSWPHLRPRLSAAEQAAGPLRSQRAEFAPPLVSEPGQGPSHLQGWPPVHCSVPGIKPPGDGTLIGNN
ncbi:hypothetical protein NDU88_006284 [Pleurodeles waltl]|uniref:Uncharacterized protein n=1 Tax=Pleurodeles waltl TaxID=8319 RepID=A0AAV7VP96_PLEWA|nr:hypothetical protein NDU88_006284 [Pleurodeles waltl]